MPHETKKPGHKDPGHLDDANRPLFERLRAHRAELARSRRVPAYVVALDRTLVELATQRPGVAREQHCADELSGPLSDGSANRRRDDRPDRRNREHAALHGATG